MFRRQLAKWRDGHNVKWHIKQGAICNKFFVTKNNYFLLAELNFKLFQKIWRLTSTDLWAIYFNKIVTGMVLNFFVLWSSHEKKNRLSIKYLRQNSSCLDSVLVFQKESFNLLFTFFISIFFVLQFCFSLYSFFHLFIILHFYDFDTNFNFPLLWKEFQ